MTPFRLSAGALVLTGHSLPHAQYVTLEQLRFKLEMLGGVSSKIPSTLSPKLVLIY